MGESEGSRAEAEEDDLSGGAPENSGGAAGKVGEVQARCVKTQEARGASSYWIQHMDRTRFAVWTDSAAPTSLDS